MRKIKFRAWDTEGGGFIAGFNMSGFSNYAGGLPQIQQFSTVWDRNSFILEQYTGLKDKAGKEIFEGDLVSGWVHNPSEVFVVKFKASKFSCGFKAQRSNDGGYTDIWYDGFKIIGNIHENPELLK